MIVRYMWFVTWTLWFFWAFCLMLPIRYARYFYSDINSLSFSSDQMIGIVILTIATLILEKIE